MNFVFWHNLSYRYIKQFKIKNTPCISNFISYTIYFLEMIKTRSIPNCVKLRNKTKAQSIVSPHSRKDLRAKYCFELIFRKHYSKLTSWQIHSRTLKHPLPILVATKLQLTVFGINLHDPFARILSHSLFQVSSNFRKNYFTLAPLLRLRGASINFHRKVKRARHREKGQFMVVKHLFCLQINYSGMPVTVRSTAPEVVHNGTPLVAGYYRLHVSSVSARFSGVPLRMSVRIYPIGDLPHLPEWYLAPLLRETTINANLYRWMFVALRSISSKRNGHFQYLR